MTIGDPWSATRVSKTWFCFCQSTKLAGETAKLSQPLERLFSQT
jgi:hypothetical protein